MKFTSHFPAIVAGTLVLTLTGCGGSNSSGGGGTTGTTGKARLIVTSRPGSGVDHVWVNIKKVQAVQAGSGTLRTLFDDTDGVVVDLKTLTDTSGHRFEYLTTNSMPVGYYTGLQVTLDRSFVYYPTGATTGITSNLSGTGTTTALPLGFIYTRAFTASGDTYVIDFDLSRWNFATPTTTATGLTYVVEGATTGLTSTTAWEPTEITGTITQLSGTFPTQVYVVTKGTRSISVVGTASSVIYADDGASSTTLAVGQTVQVRGPFNSNGNYIVPTSTKIRYDATASSQTAVATVQSVSGSVVTVQVAQPTGFLPLNTFTLDTSMGGTYLSSAGAAVTPSNFTAALTPGTKVDVEGSFSGSTITVKRAKISS